MRSPSPSRAVQRARLWAITWTASQAPVGGEAAGRQVIEPHAVLQVADRVLDLGVAAMVGLQFERLSVAVGDEGVVAIRREESELRTRRRPHAPDDEPHRDGVRRVCERRVGRL